MNKPNGIQSGPGGGRGVGQSSAVCVARTVSKARLGSWRGQESGATWALHRGVAGARQTREPAQHTHSNRVQSITKVLHNGVTYYNGVT